VRSWERRLLCCGATIIGGLDSLLGDFPGDRLGLAVAVLVLLGCSDIEVTRVDTLRCCSAVDLGDSGASSSSLVACAAVCLLLAFTGCGDPLRRLEVVAILRCGSSDDVALASLGVEAAATRLRCVGLGDFSV
jgi:hypothetical protein